MNPQVFYTDSLAVQPDVKLGNNWCASLLADGRAEWKVWPCKSKGPSKRRELRQSGQLVYVSESDYSPRPGSKPPKAPRKKALRETVVARSRMPEDEQRSLVRELAAGLLGDVYGSPATQ